MAKNVNEDESPFRYPACSETTSYFHRWKMRRRRDGERRRKSSCTGNEQSCEAREASDVSRGSQVVMMAVDRMATGAKEMAKKQKIPERMNATTDVDSGYFTKLAGRAVREKFFLHRYVQNAREVFQTRLLADQERDEYVRMEQGFVEEQERLEQTRHRYRRYVDDFERFLSKDHEASMAIMDEASEGTVLTDDLTVRKNFLSKEFARVRLEVLAREESWRIAKMCQKFLYQISPTTRRVEHGASMRRSESEGAVVSTNADDLPPFGRTKQAPEKLPSLESLIGLGFERDVAAAGPSSVYHFEDPMDLARIFRAMETQNLNAMIHLESLAGAMADAMTTIATAETRMKREIREIREAIMDLEDSIRETEERIITLEGCADNLLENVFRRLVCSRSVLELRIFVEDTYESCVGPNDANLESFSMMRSIEKTYETVNLELDSLPRGIVQTCEREGFMAEAKAMKEAEDAAKKFELMHRLMASLKRTMQPAKTRGRRSMYRSAPAQRQNVVEIATDDDDDVSHRPTAVAPHEVLHGGSHHPHSRSTILLPLQEQTRGTGGVG